MNPQLSKTRTMFIKSKTSMPGILALFDFNPGTAQALNQLAETLLRGDSELTRGFRELIAAHVSEANGCEFCCKSHTAFAAELLGEQYVHDVIHHGIMAHLTPREQGLLDLAEDIAISPPMILSEEKVKSARDRGASDSEIHDTVLIASAFCMFNRYVSGLGVDKPNLSDEAYKDMAKRITSIGYALQKELA